MKKLFATISVFATLGLAACGGSSGGATVNGVSHERLAQMFVQSLDASGQMSVTLTKSNTDQYNWIIVYDAATNQYTAVNLSSYQPNTDAWTYFQNFKNTFYYDLAVIPGHYEAYSDGSDEYWVGDKYRDQQSGITFEKVNASPKDLEKMAALKEAVATEKSAEKLQTSFGLSAERSEQVARLTAAWKKAGGKDLTPAEHDQFSKEVLGFTITDAKAAWGSNNEASIDQLIDQAAKTNGTTPENVRQIIGGFVDGN